MKPKPSTAPRPDTVPLLTRVPPNPKTPNQPAYVSTFRPRPLPELTGHRRIPVFAVTANKMPFLRLRKPPSPVLSRVLRQKGFKRSQRAGKMRELGEEEMPFAEQEDMWEGEVGRLLSREPYTPTRKSAEGTYTTPLLIWRTHLSRKLNDEKKDMMARGKALWEIVKQEKALAEREKAERREDRRKRWLERTEGDKSGN